MVERPPRRQPSLLSIATYWLDRPEWPAYVGNYIGLGEPFCAACGWLAPVDDTADVAAAWRLASRWLERAHIIDRWSGGLDHEANAVPLCFVCHDSMPMFRPGAEAAAWDWVRQHEPKPWEWQVATDAVAPDRLASRSARRHWIHDAWLRVEGARKAVHAMTHATKAGHGAQPSQADRTRDEQHDHAQRNA